VTGAPLTRTSASGMLLATLRMLPYAATALDRAGSGAWRDMWRAMPPIALAAWLWRNARGRRAAGAVRAAA
jgi:hypothetical protein